MSIEVGMDGIRGVDRTLDQSGRTLVDLGNASVLLLDARTFGLPRLHGVEWT